MYISKCGVRVCAVFIGSEQARMAGCLNMVTAVDVSIICEFLTLLKTTSCLAKPLLRGVIQCSFINLLFLQITSPFPSSSSSSSLFKIHLDPTLTISPSFHVIVCKQAQFISCSRQNAGLVHHLFEVTFSQYSFSVGHSSTYIYCRLVRNANFIFFYPKWFFTLSYFVFQGLSRHCHLSSCVSG